MRYKRMQQFLEGALGARHSQSAWAQKAIAEASTEEAEADGEVGLRHFSCEGMGLRIREDVTVRWLA